MATYKVKIFFNMLFISSMNINDFLIIPNAIVYKITYSNL